MYSFFKDRYIFQSEGADQLCGRMVAGLPFNDKDFSILPPHFPHDLLERMDGQFWSTIIDGYDNYPKGIKSAFSFMLASLVYHEKYLRQNINKKHVIFSARWSTQNPLLDEMRERVLCGHSICKSTDLKATGIPAHLACALEVKQQRKMIEDLIKKMDAIEKNQQVFFRAKLQEMAESIPIAVAREIRSNFLIEGVVPLTSHDLDRRLNEMEKNIHALLATSSSTFKEMIEQQRKEPTSPTTEEPFKWDSWTHPNCGHITHSFPIGWEFPDYLPLKNLWDLWYFGDKEQRIRPFKDIDDDMHSDKSKVRRSRARGVMLFCETLIKEYGILNDKTITQLSIIDSDNAFQEIFMVLVRKLRGRRNIKRVEEKSYGTFYKWLLAYNKKNAERS
jgi:hypothetical protein